MKKVIFLKDPITKKYVGKIKRVTFNGPYGLACLYNGKKHIVYKRRNGAYYIYKF